MIGYAIDFVMICLIIYLWYELEQTKQVNTILIMFLKQKYDMTPEEIAQEAINGVLTKDYFD